MRGRDIGIGEIGCALSHLSIYNKILQDGLAGALIFEDDVLIKNLNILDITNRSIESINVNSYVLHLGIGGDKLLKKSTGEELRVKS